MRLSGPHPAEITIKAGGGRGTYTTMCPRYRILGTGYFASLGKIDVDGCLELSRKHYLPAVALNATAPLLECMHLVMSFLMTKVS